MLTIVENALTAETYCRLRQKVRFRPYRPEDAAAALKNSLFTTATPGTEGFYEKYGFIRRPTADLGHGMVQFVPVSLPETRTAVATIRSISPFESTKEDFL